MVMLGIFAAIALLFTLLEWAWPQRPQPLFRRGLWVDVSYAFLHTGIRIAITGTLAAAMVRLGGAIMPGAVGLLAGQPVWLQAVAIVITLDLFFYVMHRLKHRWAWWWRLHETHHSSVDLHWFSSVRFHPLEKLLDRAIYLLPLTVLGPSDAALLVLATVDALVAGLSHSNLDVRLGPLNYVLMGPELHRWHHATDPAMQRHNFGNNLSIFDWLFGTALWRRDAPTQFGLQDPSYPETSLWGQLRYAFRPAASPLTPRETAIAQPGSAPR